MNRMRAAALAIVLAAACSHGAMAQDPGTLAASADAIALGAGPTEIVLVAPDGASVATRLKGVEPGRQVYLTFVRAQAAAAISTTYNVYVGLPAHAGPAGTSDAHYVGTLSFFNAASGRPTDISLNITARLGRLLQAGDRGDLARVTIVPAGPPPDTPPSIGGVRLTSR